MMGVNYDLFWKLNPKSLKPFVKAFELSLEHEDTVAWQLGSYIRMAIASCLDKNAKYPKHPIMDKSEPKLKPMSAEEIKARVMAHAQIINAKFRKE